MFFGKPDEADPGCMPPETSWFLLFSGKEAKSFVPLRRKP
jgi:hypothetical protein